jgi:hypothetical protein
MANRFIRLQKQGELGRQQSHFSLADGGGGGLEPINTTAKIAGLFCA